MFYRTILGALAALTISPASGWAQDVGVLSHWYGSGVHAYFSGDTTRALEDLTQAVDAGTKDPRVYYFRGLTYMKMGQSDAAEMDMQIGGELEAQDRDGRYPVSRSLERIQGNQRLVLEKYRRKARAANYQRQVVRRRQRYEALRRQESQVLRRQIAVPLDRLAVPVAGTEPIEQPVSPPETAVPGTPVEPRSPVAVEAPVPAQQPVPAASTAAGGLAEAPDQPAAPTTPLVKPVPEGEKVGAGKLGRILGRVIGKSLPEGEKPAGAAAGAVRDPFGDSLPEGAPALPAPAQAAPPRATPAPAPSAPAPQPAEATSPDDLFGGDTTEPAALPAKDADAAKQTAPPADQGAAPDPFGDEEDPLGAAKPADGGAAKPAAPDQPEPAAAPAPPKSDEKADEANPFADS